MKVIKYILGFCILIGLNSGCSFLCKVPVFETKESLNWKDCNTCYQYSAIKLKTKSYQFNADSFLITICPSAKPGLNFLFGPPFVPVIPNPFILFPIKPNAKFFVDIKIDSNKRNLTIDLSKFQFNTYNDSLIKPSLIKIIASEHYGMPEEFFYHRRFIKNGYVDFNDSIVKTNVIKVSTPMIIRFEFSVLTTKVKRLSIKYESMPEIKFKKHNKFFYKPFVFAS